MTTSTVNVQSLNQFSVNRAIDSIKRAEFELKEIDLRTVPAISRTAIKEARTKLADTRKLLSNPFPEVKE